MTRSGWTSATPPATAKICSTPACRTLTTPIFQGRQDRGVVRQDAHFAGGAGQDDHVHLALKDDRGLERRFRSEWACVVSQTA